MPKLTLPTGWPDPYDLLRDLNWRQNYPAVFLRGIFDIMERARSAEKKSPALIRKRRKEFEVHARSRGKPMPGDVERRYLAGFNISLYKLVKARPPRFHIGAIQKGSISKKHLTSYGQRREKEVLGVIPLSAETKRRTGDLDKNVMARDTKYKLDQLALLIAAVRGTTAEPGMPTTEEGSP